MASTPQQPAHSALLEAGSWRLLPPPRESNEKIEVGVLEIHPSRNRVAYTTRSRTDQGQDIGRTRIVIHDFEFDHHESSSDNNNSSNNGNNIILAMFSLRELTKRMNEFRTKEQLTATTHYNSHSQEILQSLTTKPIGIIPYTVQMLGAVQNIAFLPFSNSNVQRLMIGFRRCVVVVSTFHTNEQNSTSCARGVHVIAYIGPDDLDEFESNEKERKRQPSSFPIPISENIVAYGCYDGGIRFYDLHRRKQVKACLGPNGRGNPVVRVINASTTQSNDTKMNTTGTISDEKHQLRIISVCATGVAYLWAIDLAIHSESGEVLHFDIPPPLVSFDGLVAAVSGKGIPVKYPSSLSPTSISTLSPCSSWQQTDEVNSQFEVSFDRQRNLLYWVFSPDCLGVTLNSHATREERLKMDGAMVCWELENLPSPEWPPPILPPKCVVQLPRTEVGRVVAERVLPGIHGVLSTSYLTTIYITSDKEIMAAVTDLNRQRGSAVQVDSNVTKLADLKGLEYQYNCYTVAASEVHPSLIAIGSQYGILFVQISSSPGLENVKKELFPITEEEASQSLVRSLSDSSSERIPILSQEQKTLLVSKVKQLEHENKELKSQLNDMKHEASKHDINSTELNDALTKVQTLENELRLNNNVLRLNNNLSQALQTEVNTLKGTLSHLSEELEQERYTTKSLKDTLSEIQGELEQEKHNNLEIATKLASVEDRAKTLEKIAAHSNDLLAECESLRLQLDETRKELKEAKECERDSRLTVGDYKLDNSAPAHILQQELFTAKETEESLRNYIELLEEDKAIQDKDLERARQQAEVYAKERDKMASKSNSAVHEHKMAIDSLCDLLERQQQTHSKEKLAQNDEIDSLKKQLADMSAVHQKELDEMKKKECSLEMFLAMKIELQNALNELAEYQHDERTMCTYEHK